MRLAPYKFALAVLLFAQGQARCEELEDPYDEATNQDFISRAQRAEEKLHTFALTSRKSIASDARQDAEIKAALNNVSAFIKLAAEEDAARLGFKGSVTIGANTDEAGPTRQSKASAGASVSFGTYPNQLRVKLDASVRYDKSAVSEDVTSMLVNYDHYITPDHEVYSFFERFSDSFISIDQRYEIGTGMKLEFTKKSASESRPLMKPMTKSRPYSKDECIEAYTKEGCKKLAAIEKAQKEASTGLTKLQSGSIDPDFQGIVDELKANVEKINVDDILDSRRKEFTRREWGFALGALYEFENPAGLKRTVQTVDGTGTVLASEEKTLDPPSAQRFRASARLSAKYRIGERTEVEGKFYYKPALDSPRKVSGEEDYRMDGYLRLGWALTAMSGAKKPPSIALVFEWHYDNVPPDPTSVLAAGERLDPAGLQTAERTHRIIKLNVEVPLN